VREVQRMFDRHGSTEMYVRVATRTHARDVDAEHGLARALERARLAAATGRPLNPELGLWAVYGDIAFQPGPDFTDYPSIRLRAPWEQLTLEEMCDALQAYGALVARQILGTGVKVPIWDLGNEIEFGLAGVAVRSFTTSHGDWTYTAPDGVDPEIGRVSAFDLFAMTNENRIAWLQTHLWPAVGRMLAAVASGVRTVDPNARFSTHTSTTALLLPGVPQAFWESMRAAGFEADELGASYYPTSSAFGNTVESIQGVSADLHERFGKPVFLSETSYPSGRMELPFAWNDAVAGYPISPEGQHTFVRDLARWGVQSGHLSGIRLWAPDYCTGGWQPMSCFSMPVDGVATAKPVLDAVDDGVDLARRAHH